MKNAHHALASLHKRSLGRTCCRANSLNKNPPTPPTRKGAMPSSRQQPRQPGLQQKMQTIQEEDHATLTAKDTDLYKDLARIRDKQSRIADFYAWRPTLTWHGTEDHTKPPFGSWHYHPDVPGLHCLMWDGPVPQREAERRGQSPPTNIIEAYIRKIGMTQTGSASSSSGP